jgi:hypothetical protein
LATILATLGFLKDNVYRNNPHAVDELKGKITAAVKGITEETLAAVMEKFIRHKQMVKDAHRSYTEYNFYLNMILRTAELITYSLIPEQHINKCIAI